MPPTTIGSSETMTAQSLLARFFAWREASARRTRAHVEVWPERLTRSTTVTSVQREWQRAIEGALAARGRTISWHEHHGAAEWGVAIEGRIAADCTVWLQNDGASLVVRGRAWQREHWDCESPAQLLHELLEALDAMVPSPPLAP